MQDTKRDLPRLDGRLAAAVPFVRAGARVADIGTDHAYLPIVLVAERRVSAALAADINRGPIERAAAHIRAAGYAERIATLCTDGLHGVEPFAPDDVIVFGMGGDLIVRILEEAPWMKTPGKRVILQPMTHADTVREYLCAAGYTIVDEVLARADRVYQIIAADYTGTVTQLTEAEKKLGRNIIARGGQLFKELLAREIRTAQTKLDGKRSAGQDTAAEEALLAEYRAVAHREENRV